MMKDCVAPAILVAGLTFGLATRIIWSIKRAATKEHLEYCHKIRLRVSIGLPVGIFLVCAVSR